MADVFEKHASGGLLLEAAGLRWLGEAEKDGGICVARVVSASDTHLVEECIRECAPTRAMARRAGAALARTHGAGADFWGAPPHGASGNYMLAGSITPCATSSTDAPNWGSFYARFKIQNYLSQLPQNFFSAAELARFEQLCKLLESGEFDAPQPSLVGKRPARVHGDLWAGNLLWSEDAPTGATLIDPMAHGGHAEEDLAMLALFGCAYLDDFLAAYNEVSELAHGWKERVRLMQLAPLLHHCVLFGSSYKAQTLLALAAYV